MLTNLCCHLYAFNRCSQVSFSDTPITAVKGQWELLEWCCLPKEAYGFEVWVPIPQGLLLLGAIGIIFTVGPNLHQTLKALVRGFRFTNLSHFIRSNPCCLSSHQSHPSQSHALSWHLLHCKQKPLHFKYSVHLSCHGEHHMSCL